jgi:hypothetical protein
VGDRFKERKLKFAVEDVLAKYHVAVDADAIIELARHQKEYI